MKKLGIIIVAAISLLGMQSCYFAFNDELCISGYGSIVAEEVEMEAFTAVVNKTVVDVIIEQGETQVVTVEGHQNMINEVSVYTIGDKMYIDLNNHCYRNFQLTVYVTVPTLESVSLKSTGDAFVDGFEDLNELLLSTSSTGDIYVDGAISANLVELRTSSTGNIEAEIYTDDLFVNITGTGDVKLEGSTIYQDINMSSTGNYEAFDLDSEICDIVCSGTGDAELYVEEELNVTIRSTGDVYYLGSPSVSLNDSGVGDLIGYN